MIPKLWGAGLILLGCGGFGLSLVLGHKREEAALRMLLHVLKWMENELRYRLTPLPELLSQAAAQAAGCLRRVLLRLSQELERQEFCDASQGMHAILASDGEVPRKVRKILTLLGSSLGRFDLAGQLEGIREVQLACAEELSALANGREERLRSYQTLSLCAGAALVILMI